MAYAERFQVKFERAPTGYAEDVDVLTIHFRQATGIGLDATIRANVQTAFGTFWSSYKTRVHDFVALTEYRWYDQRVHPTLSPLIQSTAVTPVPGTASASQALPPQIATSVTLMNDVRRRWGRFYLPFTNPSDLTALGRMDTSDVDAICDLALTFLQAADSAGAVPVVWSPRGGVGPPTFAAGDLLDVTKVRVDDILDVVRSRRWQSLPYRKTNTV